MNQCCILSEHAQLLPSSCKFACHRLKKEFLKFPSVFSLIESGGLIETIYIFPQIFFSFRFFIFYRFWNASHLMWATSFSKSMFRFLSSSSSFSVSEALTPTTRSTVTPVVFSFFCRAIFSFSVLQHPVNLHSKLYLLTCFL